MTNSQHLGVTAIVPAFNRSQLIAETLRSLLSQKLRFAEIIVVDDGSSDRTAEVVGSFGQQVHLVRTSNRGVQHARNRGVLAASTEWVCLCDSDDILLPYCNLIVNDYIVTAPHYDMVFSRHKPLPADDRLDDPSSPSKDMPGDRNQVPTGDFDDLQEDPFPRILEQQFLWPTGLFIRRKAFLDLGGYDTRFRGLGSEDLEFTVRALLALRAAVSRDVLALVRRHPGNDSADSVRQLIGEVVVLEHLLRTQPALRFHRWRIQESMKRRLGWALGGAWGRGDFVTFMEISSSLRLRDHDWQSLIQRMIVSSPPSLREFLWRLIRQK